MTGIIEELSELRKILCICPCCGKVVRVSDLHLKVKKPITKTWLDTYESKIIKMTEEEQKFDEKEDKLRDKAKELGRKEAEKMVSKCVLPIFLKMKIDPYDVKPILNPIDFIVFDGMDKKEKINNIILLSKTSKAQLLNLTRKQIKDVVSKQNYSWQVGRIDDSGNLTYE